MSVCTAYPCLLKNRQIFSVRISETLSLNQYVAIRREWPHKVRKCFWYSTLFLGYCYTNFAKTKFLSNNQSSGFEILFVVTWDCRQSSPDSSSVADWWLRPACKAEKRVRYADGNLPKCKKESLFGPSFFVTPTGLKPVTFWSVVRRSILLSYAANP